MENFGGESTLRELEAFAGARLAGLLAFLFARVALEVSGFLEGGPELGVELLQGAGDAVGHGDSLAAVAAAGDIGGDVDLVAHLHGEERRSRLLGEIFVGEIVVEVAAVDEDLAGAGGDADPGAGGFAAAGGG